MNASAPERTYDFPWGTRPICPTTHEARISGADVEVVRESSETCPRFYCESCCEQRCCGACHSADVVGDAECCAPCTAALATDLSCRLCHETPVRAPGDACAVCVESLLTDASALEEEVQQLKREQR